MLFRSLLTKYRLTKTSDCASTSDWINGLEWMRSKSESLPSYQPIHPPLSGVEEFNKETFQEIEINCISERQVLTHRVGGNAKKSYKTPPPNWVIDTFRFVELGWERANFRLKTVVRAVQIFKHLLHKKRSVFSTLCYLCTENDSWLSKQTELVIARATSDQVEKAFGEKYLSLKFFKEQNIWLSKFRLSKEGPFQTVDLDFSAFFDACNLKKLLPVVLVGSEVFHSLLFFIHMKAAPHKGVENTLKKFLEYFYPLGHARQAIAQFNSSCSKCNLLMKRTIEMELADFPMPRSVIAPPFYSIQMDIAMNFKARPSPHAKKLVPCHALVIVCLLTGATNILALESLATQSVVQALERHSARYGVPGQLFVDAGTQLEKLKDCTFRLHDSNKMPVPSSQFKIVVATPKAHHQQGRVETRIKALKSILAKWSNVATETNSFLGWETIFSLVADTINDVPMARGSDTAPNDLGWEIITPNRLLLGRNNFRQLEGEIKLDNCPQSQLTRNRLISQKWYEIFIEKIHLLVPPPQRKDSLRPKCGDICLFVHQDTQNPKLWVWKLGIIERQMSRTTFEIRHFLAKSGQTRLLERSVRQISIIVPVDTVPVSSRDFYS